LLCDVVCTDRFLRASGKFDPRRYVSLGSIATFFARRGFVMGVAIGSLSMFSIMSLLFPPPPPQ
jgi:hypothetical protein